MLLKKKSVMEFPEYKELNKPIEKSKVLPKKENKKILLNLFKKKEVKHKPIENIKPIVIKKEEKKPILNLFKKKEVKHKSIEKPKVLPKKENKKPLLHIFKKKINVKKPKKASVKVIKHKIVHKNIPAIVVEPKEINNLDKKISKLEKDYSDLLKKISAFDKREKNYALKNELISFNRRIDKVESDIRSIRKEINSAKLSNKNLYKKLDYLTNYLRELANAQNQLTISFNKLSEFVSEKES